MFITPFSRGGLVSFSDVGNSPAKADVDPIVDFDSFLKINAFCDSAFVTMAGACHEALENMTSKNLPLRLQASYIVVGHGANSWRWCWRHQRTSPGGF